VPETDSNEIQTLIKSGAMSLWNWDPASKHSKRKERTKLGTLRGNNDATVDGGSALSKHAFGTNKNMAQGRVSA
jgi:hypothetical protein